MPDELDYRYFGDRLSATQLLDKKDSDRWGIPTYRISPKSREDLRAHEDAFVIARIDAECIELVQYALKIGYLLCDTLTYWRGKIGVLEQKPLDAGYWAREITPQDRLNITSLAFKSFQGYPSHYAADPRTKPQVARVYGEWAGSHDGPGILIEHERCEFPYVHRTPVAFGLFSEPCELALAAVDEAHQGHGLYAHLVRACAAWGAARRVETIEISTQVSNLAVQKVWARHGLVPYKHAYTLHRWP